MARKPADIDDYLERVSGSQLKALKQLRKTIRSILPDAEECISYGIPAFRYDGQVVAGFMATSRGCSYLPFSGSTLPTLAQELRGYSQTKSSLHFDPEKGLPVSLVRKLLKVRCAELRR